MHTKPAISILTVALAWAGSAGAAEGADLHRRRSAGGGGAGPRLVRRQALRTRARLLPALGAPAPRRARRARMVAAPAGAAHALPRGETQPALRARRVEQPGQ